MNILRVMRLIPFMFPQKIIHINRLLQDPRKQGWFRHQWNLSISQ